MVKVREEELRGIFKSLDRDGSGAVSKREFTAGVAASPRLRDIFCLYDWKAAAGDDGTLSYEELRRLSRSAGTFDARPLFVATKDWQTVPPGALCPGGLEYKFDLTSGGVRARGT